MKRWMPWLVIAALVVGFFGIRELSERNAHQGHVEVSLAKSYNSVQELVGDSTSVVRVTAGNQAVSAASQGGGGPVPATVTTVTVDEVFSGSAQVGDSLAVRQTGTKSNEVPELARPLTPGGSYLLFLTPFEFEPGSSTGQDVPVGGVGVYLASGDAWVVDVAEPGSLPTRITRADLSAAQSS